MIKRDFYLKQLIKLKNNKKIKVIVGLRRVGKSYLLMNLYKQYLLNNGVDLDQIIMFSLDGIENIHLRNPLTLYNDIKELIIDSNKEYYLFIDEIQLVKKMSNPHTNKDDIITFVDVVLGLNHLDNVDIYITGSNSKMLSQDILTEMRGKSDLILVNPLSYYELSCIENPENKNISDYLVYGGMPEIYSSLYNQNQSKQYLKNLFRETYIKDVLERNNIQNDKEVLEILLDFIASSIGSFVSFNKLSNRFLSEKKIKVSSNAISKYLEYFENSFIISSAKRYDIKGRAFFKVPIKYYFTDLGLRNARLNFKNEDSGHLMENLIYNELIRRGFTVDVGVVEVDEKIDNKIIRKQLEVDFIAKFLNNKYYIQSTISIEDSKVKKREIKPLLAIRDMFPKIVIVRDNMVSFYDDNGIYYISLKEFLLKDNIFNKHFN